MSDRASGNVKKMTLFAIIAAVLIAILIGTFFVVIVFVGMDAPADTHHHQKII